MQIHLSVYATKSVKSADFYAENLDTLSRSQGYDYDEVEIWGYGMKRSSKEEEIAA